MAQGHSPAPGVEARREERYPASSDRSKAGTLPGDEGSGRRQGRICPPDELPPSTDRSVTGPEPRVAAGPARAGLRGSGQAAGGRDRERGVVEERQKAIDNDVDGEWKMGAESLLRNLWRLRQ